MPKPQRLCTECQQVALTEGRFCKNHARQRTAARSQRAVAVRLQRFLPENRPLIGVIETPLLGNAAAIVRSADSITRALLNRRIDTRRAGLFYYCLQTAFHNLKNLRPDDPHHPIASQAMRDLGLTLTDMKSVGRAR